MPEFLFASYRVLMLITYSFASLYVLVLGFFGLRQGHVFFTLPETETHTISPKIKNKPNKIPIPGDKAFLNRLIQFMEDEKPYLDSELTLKKLSKMLKVKQELLSNTINTQLNQNFFDFINKYRIEAFKIQSLMESNKHLSILGLAFQCGFNSKASFYRAFKKFEGMSPGEYFQQSQVL
ncbi:helix-turn-helix domain-containing protein [Fidelibacter multiformis]|jgi:AraC-like DNA-binding protein|uniref:helix-turn-helix domain-containing protein n=1 Tax=Fidelibacter multiformis TaxID=3377529 RepID=UPI0037DD2021